MSRIIEIATEPVKDADLHPGRLRDPDIDID